MAIDCSSRSSSSQNIPLSDLCSQTAFYSAKKTFANRKNKWGEAAPTLDHYYCQLLRTPTHTLAITSDGIGTKIELAERCEIYSTLGYDLVAMVADDIICSGAEPTHLSNILDVDALDSKIVGELFSGLQEAAEEVGMMITGGETAELGSRIGGYGSKMHFNWCATGLGVLPNDKKPIDGSEIQVGDAVLSLRSCGLRSNGFSLARKILNAQFGESWHKAYFTEEKTWGEQLLTPSLIYAPHILHLLQRGYPIRGIAHITGGGIAGNFERILAPWNKGALLDALYAPHEEMKQLQSLGEITDRQAYETWNMGNAMLLVVPPYSVDKVLEELKERHIHAKQAGLITEERAITLHTRVSSQLQFSYED
jgi:phosphoribosylformylglycinamidine cyclo-ligase